MTNEQIERAPIIVSTNNQTDGAGNKGKDVCKSSRSVIVRAGSASVSNAK